MPSATSEAPVAFVPTMLINIRFPEERVAFTEDAEFKGRPTKQMTGDHAQFTNTQYVAKTQEELDHLLAACPYLYVEPLDGPLFEDKTYGFATRNLQAYQ